MSRVVEDDGWQPRFVDKSALFAPLRALAAPLVLHASWPTVDEVSRVLEPRAGVRFVVQPPRGRRKRRATTSIDAVYDAQITLGLVPTRERSWHDFLNALVWARFPRAKRALHARQAAAIRAGFDVVAGRVAKTRTREQDALAMIDEGGVMLLCSSEDEAEVRAATQTLDAAILGGLLDRRRVQAIVFGHALYEGLVLDGPPAIAAACVLPIDEPLPALPDALDAACTLVDAALAVRLEGRFPQSRDDFGHVALAAIAARNG